MKMCFLFYLFALHLSAQSEIVYEEEFIAKDIVITNTNAYTGIALVCCNPSPQNAHCYRVQENEVLTYAYNTTPHFYLFAFPTDLLEEYGGLESTNASSAAWESPEINFFALLEGMESTFYLIEEFPSDLPMESDTRYYELAGSIDTNLTLVLKKRVVTFDDGTPDKTITY